MAAYVQKLDAGEYTQSSLALFAANTADNMANINLVGMKTAGFVYEVMS